jgi:hypothetical protein
MTAINQGNPNMSTATRRAMTPHQPITEIVTSLIRRYLRDAAGWRGSMRGESSDLISLGHAPAPSGRDQLRSAAQRREPSIAHESASRTGVK